MTHATPTSLRRAGLELLAASFMVLFQELTLIRWLPVEVRVLAYFPNLILIGAFLGLGVGALRGRKSLPFWLWPVSLLAVVGAASFMSGTAFTANDVSEHLWLLYHDLPSDAPVVNGIKLPIVALFVLAGVSFVPLGHLIGSRLDVFRERSSPLWGYSLDLGGSLLGVVGFAAVSALGLRPVWWFAPLLVLGFFVGSRSLRSRAVVAVCAAAVLGVVGTESGTKLFSPYYALEAVEASTRAVDIRANGSLHQIALDLVPGRGEGQQVKAAEGYRYPYERLGRPIRKALVLGAGTGNDVAVLLSLGAQEVHAVEIDPAILQLGRDLHPNRPYDDPRVVVHNTDARSFLNESEEHFDVITFGTLDSMTRLSALSNVRLDNFVYTREALTAARDHLTEDGGLILYFMVGDVFISEHLTALLANVFGRVPEIHLGAYSLFNTIFMAGPAFGSSASTEAEAEDGDEAWFQQDDLVEALSPTDDWPYLYLPRRGVSRFYLLMMGILALVAVGAVFSVSGELRASLRSGHGIDLEMFLYGFAFLLIETKLVTAMNLLWGATWLTSAVVFGAILACILVGTVFMERRPIPWQVAAVGVVATLLVTYLMPPHTLLFSSTSARLAASVAYAGGPILFASLCFAARFKARSSASVAFGWNLLGAVLGGLAEFLSMLVGLRALTLVAVVAYLGAFLVARRTDGAGEPSAVA